jgi:hypothetical protein
MTAREARVLIGYRPTIAPHEPASETLGNTAWRGHAQRVARRPRAER